jgi:hypothetical protein
MYTRSTRTTTGFGSRIIAVILVIWFVIGATAAAQRHYFDSGAASCAHAGTVVVTILAGPLNYVGANPKVSSCHAPQPSK